MLSLNFAWLNGSDVAERGRERFKELVVQQLGIKVPDDYARKWPEYTVAEWGNNVDAILEVLK